MTIADHLRKIAQEAADDANARISELDRQLAEIEKQKAEIDAKRTDARGVFQRLANFPVTSGVDYLCPLCWVDDDKRSLLAPVASQTRQDLFSCRVCHFETAY